MRCLLCGTTVKATQANQAHCWSRSQHCAICHYLGEPYHRSFKFWNA